VASKCELFVPTEDMAADILTKSLMRPYVEKRRSLMGLRTWTLHVTSHHGGVLKV